jgi:hypothetical protein
MGRNEMNTYEVTYKGLTTEPVNADDVEVNIGDSAVYFTAGEGESREVVAILNFAEVVSVIKVEREGE